MTPAVLAAAAAAPNAIESISLFPFGEYWWFYAGFLALVGVLLALDLGVFHREAHVVSFKEAATWSVVWVSLAMLFLGGFYLYMVKSFPGNERLMAVPGSTRPRPRARPPCSSWPAT
jgi:hypothetical protein